MKSFIIRDCACCSDQPTVPPDCPACHGAGGFTRYQIADGVISPAPAASESAIAALAISQGREAITRPLPERKTLIQAQTRRHYERTCSLLAQIRALEAKLAAPAPAAQVTPAVSPGDTPASAGEGDLREAAQAILNRLLRYNASDHMHRAAWDAFVGEGAWKDWRALRAALARPAAPAVDVPAERERIARIIRARVAISLEHSQSIADAILATRPTDPGGARGEIVRHVKRGTEYEVLGEAEAQVAVAVDYTVWDMPARLVKDGSKITVYRGSDGKLWCRFTDEFRDGRFMPAASTASSDAGGAV